MQFSSLEIDVGMSFKKKRNQNSLAEID